MKKITFQIGLEVFVITKVKNTVPWTYVISDLNGEKIVGMFYEKMLQKAYQKEFETEKAIKWKGDKLYVKRKVYSNSLIVGLIKKILLHENELFSTL